MTCADFRAPKATMTMIEQLIKYPLMPANLSKYHHHQFLFLEPNLAPLVSEYPLNSSIKPMFEHQALVQVIGQSLLLIRMNLSPGLKPPNPPKQHVFGQQKAPEPLNFLHQS